MPIGPWRPDPSRATMFAWFKDSLNDLKMRAHALPASDAAAA